MTVAAAVLPMPFTVGLEYRTDRAATATEIVLGVGHAAVIGLLLTIAYAADRAARAVLADQVTAPKTRWDWR